MILSTMNGSNLSLFKFIVWCTSESSYAKWSWSGRMEWKCTVVIEVRDGFGKFSFHDGMLLPLALFLY
jgi:hypothetical protein